MTTSPHPSLENRRLPRWLALVAAVVVGVLTTVQAKINGALGAAIDDGLVAAVISFGSGFAILLLLSALTPGGRAGLARLGRGVRVGRIRPWMLLGGLAGALTVGTQSTTVAVIGVATFTVGVVAGQTAGGVVLDRVGYGPAGVVGVTVGRIAGALLAVAAVVVALVGHGVGEAPIWMLVLPFAAGAGIAWQQATNGRLREAVDSPLTATLVNFTGGTLALAVVAGIHTIAAGPPSHLAAEPWLYLGGATGVVYIFLSAAVVRHTGVLHLGLCSVAGLLAASLVIDVLWPGNASLPLPLALTSVIIALVGVVVAVVPRWRRR